MSDDERAFIFFLYGAAITAIVLGRMQEFTVIEHIGNFCLGLGCGYSICSYVRSRDNARQP